MPARIQWTRATLAPILLTIAFYGSIALAAIAMAAMAVLPIVFAKRPHVEVPFLMGAIALVTAAWPRRNPHRPRGERVTQLAQPRLFAAIRAIATGCGEAMPQDVLLNGEMNASVAHWGGRLGLAERRVLTLGIPLLQLLTVEELAAVVAHEFGHFAGGHTNTGAWAYRVRASITTVGRRYGRLNLLFHAYGRLFLRVTRTLSRQQELDADRFAARLAGSAPLARALGKVGPGARALAAYVQHDFLPVVGAGRRPPFLAGFQQFLRTHAREQPSDRSGAQPPTVDPYDSHPPLEERLSRLLEAPDEGSLQLPDAKTIAATLLDGALDLEATVLERQLRRGVAQLPPIEWADVGMEAALPRLQAARTLLPPALAGDLRVGDIAVSGALLRGIGEDLLARRSDTARQQGADPVDLARQVLADAALAAMAAAGWQVQWVIGVGCVARKDGKVLSPHRAVARQIPVRSWQTDCDEFGVGKLPLSSPRAPQQDAPIDAGVCEQGEGPPTTKDLRPRRSRPTRHRNFARRAFANLVSDKTGWRTLAVAFVAIGLLALVVVAAIRIARPGPPDLDAWKVQSATFSSAWNRSDLGAVEAECRPDRRQRIIDCIRRAMRRWQWGNRLPELHLFGDPVEPTHDNLRADFDLPGCEAHTYWTYSDGRWWLKDVAFR